MPTICPNCLRPVRSEARFCGYCGTNLNPITLDETSAAMVLTSPADIAKEDTAPLPKQKRDPEKTRRSALVVIVILLCLVLLVAFLIHYLPVIGSYLGALFTLLLSR